MLKKLFAALISLAILVVGGTYVYIHFIKDPAPKQLSLSDRDSTTKTSAAESSSGAPASGNTSVDGTWKATPESVAGYRVQEVLFGQGTEAVGRTHSVSGSMAIAGAVVTSADFSVDIASITSDQSRRDGKFRGEIMNATEFPNATFTLTAPIDLGAIPADRVEVSAKATGELTLRGEKRVVSFDLKARRNGANIEVNGTIPVKFADYKIDNPSGGPVTTEDHGVVEFLLVFVASA
ncbi:MAG: YceI family protein [Acidimicrobiia bacterium]